jgi:hypothetical protein
MVFHDDDSLVPRLLPPSRPVVTAADPTPEVLAAVRAIVRQRESRGIGKHLPIRIQDALRRQGLDFPVEQVAGALQQL